MQRHFEYEMDELKTILNKMASLVNEQVDNGFGFINDLESDNFNYVKEKDRQIDAYDNLIMAQCENLLALYQPVAIDLRFILTAIKVNNELERCGDIAVNIAQRFKKIGKNYDILKNDYLISMSKMSQLMVTDAITSFLNQDNQLAREVIEKDDTVDRLNKNLFKLCVEKMSKNQSVVEAYSHLLVLTRQIERLADHATNIAEDVVFMVDAEIIAHEKKLKDYKLPEE